MRISVLLCPGDPALPLQATPTCWHASEGQCLGTATSVVDPRNIVLMRDAGCPVTCDITHALQQPAGRALEVQFVPSSPLLSVDACLVSITAVL